jgi:hypothetical protein
MVHLLMISALLSSAPPLAVAPNPTSLTSISPTSGMVGDPDTTITLTGTNLNGSMIVKFGSTPLAPPIYINPTTLTAIIPAASLSSGGTTAVTIAGITGSANFTVNSAAALQVANLFAPNPAISPSLYYVPGAGRPAISTSDYYFLDGLYWFRPYDLNTFGPIGQALGASKGRYLWLVSPDHPNGNFGWMDGQNFMRGFSNDPAVLPTTLSTIILWNNAEVLVRGDTWSMYQAPWLVLNPDDGTNPFYLYGEGSTIGGSPARQHEEGYATSPDLATFTVHGPSSPNSAFGGWSSFQRVYRTGANTWKARGLIGPSSFIGTGNYTGTAGTTLTYDNNGAITVIQSGQTILMGSADDITVNGQLYAVVTVDARSISGGMYSGLAPIDSTGNFLASPPVIRISAIYDGVYPGPGFLQNTGGYQEDGVLHIHAMRGFFASSENQSTVNGGIFVDPSLTGPYNITISSSTVTCAAITSAFPVVGTALAAYFLNVGTLPQVSGVNVPVTGPFSGNFFYLGNINSGAGTFNFYDSRAHALAGGSTGKVTFSSNGSGVQVNLGSGGLWEDFIDYYSYIYDSTLAASAAPVGVSASCSAGTVTISWLDALPHNTYRVYRGSSSSGPWTAIGDVTGTTKNDTPTTGWEWYYKVVTLNSGTEEASRIVHTYVSQYTAFINSHFTRVLDDGADPTTIDGDWLTTVESWLNSNSLMNSLLHWADPAFGVKQNSSGVISKVYDLGTTRLPRGGDYTTNTGSTTYSATGMNGTVPGWINGSASACGYFGGGRLNNIRRKVQITTAGVYKKVGSAQATILAQDEFGGMALYEAAGTPGTPSFLLSDSTQTKTATSTVSGSGPHVLIGVFDGTNLTCYGDGSAGTNVTGLDNNANLSLNTQLKGLAATTGTQTQFLGSGSQDSKYQYGTGYVFEESQANFTASTLLVLDKGINSTLAASLNTLLTNRITPAFSKNIKTDYSAAGDGSTNDNAAFTAFNAAALAWQATPHTGLVQLTIPAGTYMFTSGGSGNSFAAGIKKLQVIGVGNPVLSDNAGAGNGFFLGGTGQLNDNIHSARTATVSAGASQVTLLTPAQASLFTVGQYALMSGKDMQGFGFPTNPYYYEYVKITAASTITGIVSFDRPLTNSYKSTWPLYYAGAFNAVDQGGPATLYALDPTWDTEIEYNGLTISQLGQTYANGRRITYRNCVATGTAGFLPTQNEVWRAIGCTMTNCGMEVDKIIGKMVLSGTTIHAVDFQSASVNTFEVYGSNITDHINGNGKLSTIKNSTLASFAPGAHSYGVSTELTCDTCVINALSPGGLVESLTGNGYTISSGVIQVANSHGPIQWDIPGAALFLDGTYAPSYPFTVTDITQDVSNTYVHTNLAGGYPTFPGSGGTVSVKTHPAMACTFINCSGSADAVDVSQATPGNPLYTYTKRSYTGSIGTAPTVNVWGKLVSIKINVITPYTGTHGTLTIEAMSQFGSNTIKADGTVLFYDPVINLKAAGLRTITPSGVTGTQTGDTGLSTGGDLWLTGVCGPFMATDISGESSGVWPTFTIEIITDQSVF